MKVNPEAFCLDHSRSPRSSLFGPLGWFSPLNLQLLLSFKTGDLPTWPYILFVSELNHFLPLEQDNEIITTKTAGWLGGLHLQGKETEACGGTKFMLMSEVLSLYHGTLLPGLQSAVPGLEGAQPRGVTLGLKPLSCWTSP